MKQLILATNTLEHARFPDFVVDMGVKHAGASIVIMGDLLNIFPEPGEDLENSMYFKLYGQELIHEMQRLVDTNFKDVASSLFISRLEEMFLPLGKHYDNCLSMAQQRYDTMFEAIAEKGKVPEIIVCPGNMDYPDFLHECAARYSFLKILDNNHIDVAGLKIGAVGGNPNDAHPFRGVAEISPYEMHPKEYERRLWHMKGVNVLLTHITPIESDELLAFTQKSSVEMVISRAPFNFKAKPGFYRGALEKRKISEKALVFVRPFDVPKNDYYVLDLTKKLNLTMETWLA